MMNMIKMVEQIKALRLVPVVKLNHVSEAEPLADALIRGGLPVAEVTFRTDAAEESISLLNKKYPDMCVGAGTVVNVEQAKRAVNAGAKFLVSPGTNRKVIEFAIESDVPVFPGTCTPSEIMTVMEYGLPVVKFFPAKQYGGVDTIKSLAAPFPGMLFMPTGGINAENVMSYLAFNKIIACGGSWMVKGELISSGNFDEITRLTREAVNLVRGN